MTLRLHYTVASDRGLVRGNNEDSAYAGPHLLVLADGMGGHAAGELASQIMVSHLERLDVDPGNEDMLALLGTVADDANLEIAKMVRERPETDGMGTTLTALMFNGDHLALCHVGDSRGYRLRDGQLQQITMDDTFVQSLVNEGKLHPEDVSTHPQKSLILKAYTGRPVEPTLVTLDARVGDRLLLCSDGLSDPVTASTIEETLRTGAPEIAAQRLIELALRSGGPDNITVVVADVVDDSTLDDAARAALPATPVTAGALLGETPNDPHPDTAAGRAAALNRRPKTISPEGDSSPQPLSGAVEVPEAAEEEEVPPPRGTFRLSALIVALLVLIGLVAGGWWAYERVDNSYFLATGADDQFVVENGVDYSVFGRELHSPFQEACLTADGNLRLVDVGGTEDCPSFSLEDLPESVRTSVPGLGGGSYDDVTQQLRRLADQALPVCVTRAAAPAGDAAIAENAENADDLANPENPDDPENPAEPADTGDLASPGVNCREVN